MSIVKFVSVVALVAIVAQYAACRHGEGPSPTDAGAPSASAPASESAVATFPPPDTSAGGICALDGGGCTALTPGKLCTDKDLDYDGLRYAGKVPVCRGNMTEKMKAIVAEKYGIQQSSLPDYEFVYLVPLALGGTNDVSNVWPLHKADAAERALLEDKLCSELKSGKITQAAAVSAVKAWKPSSCR